MNYKKNGESLWTARGLRIALPLVFLMAGCQSRAPQQVRSVEPVRVTTPVKAVAPTTQASRAQEGSIATCQRELLALSKVNQRMYAQKKAEFDQLVARASVYTSVRDDIGSQTKDTMDALYKFKTQKLCSDIELAVRQSLISAGENLK